MSDSDFQQDNDVPVEEIEARNASKPISKPLRIWPAIVLVTAMVAARFVPMLAEDESMTLMILSVLGPLALSLVVIIWWMTFSRATGKEKGLVAFGILGLGALGVALLDKTMFGPGIIIITVPLGVVAFAIGAIVCRNLAVMKRTLVALLIAACGFGFSALLRSDGMWGHGALDLHWRWEPSAEQNLLAQRDQTSLGAAKEIDGQFDQWLSNPLWPKFRGANGDSRQYGTKIDTDWNQNPPKELWRIPVGPGWSSFVVAGNLLFTQEQLGEKETVVCYAADSGSELWRQSLESRFYDPLGGPGPRATPTLAGEFIYAMGANGQLQRLDAKTGSVQWTTDVREVANRKPPEWGFSSSPLVVGSVVVVHAGGDGDKGTLAFEVETGELKWSAPAGDHTYSSPESWTMGDREYVLMLTNFGLSVLEAESGKEVLVHNWKHSGYRALQPQLLNDQSVLLATQQLGTRRLKLLASGEGKVTGEEVWTSRFLKPDFNDFVVHEGHVYGFDGTIFTCIDLKTGNRKWKQGRYGKGQVLLLADSNALLVMGEDGEITLLDANPSEHKELAKFKVFEGRTWNHPVVVKDKLFVRNSEEAACFQLPMAQAAEQ